MNTDSSIEERIKLRGKRLLEKKEMVEQYDELKELVKWLGNRWLPLIEFRGNSSDAYFSVNYNGVYIRDQIKKGFEEELVRLQNEIMKPIADD